MIITQLFFKLYSNFLPFLSLVYLNLFFHIIRLSISICFYLPFKFQFFCPNLSSTYPFQFFILLLVIINTCILNPVFLSQSILCAIYKSFSISLTIYNTTYYFESHYFYPHISMSIFFLVNRLKVNLNRKTRFKRIENN